MPIKTMSDNQLESTAEKFSVAQSLVTEKEPRGYPVEGTEKFNVLKKEALVAVEENNSAEIIGNHCAILGLSTTFTW